LIQKKRYRKINQNYCIRWST